MRLFLAKLLILSAYLDEVIKGSSCTFFVLLQEGWDTIQQNVFGQRSLSSVHYSIFVD